jgi:DNA-binding response OmpR family regulator
VQTGHLINGKIGHLSNGEIPQVPDASGEFLFYTEFGWRSPRLADEVMAMRILLADDQPKVRFALRVLLERQSGYEVVGEAISAEDTLAQVQASSPDLVLIGWELPGLAGMDLLPALRRSRPGLIIIALSGRPEARRVALTAGADAFVSKADPPERLLAAIADVDADTGAEVGGDRPRRARRAQS